MNEWQPISTVPYGEWLLLWWTPTNGNEYAESFIKGIVYAERPDAYWDGQYSDLNWEEGYKPLERITHWMWPPERPADRPPYTDATFADYLRQRRESASHFAQRRGGSDLTWQKLEEMMRLLPPPAPSPFAGLFRPLVPEFCGMKIYETPPPPPKIQLSRECAELVGAEFAARTNAWLAERLGFREDPIYLISGLGITMSKRHMAMIANVTA